MMLSFLRPLYRDFGRWVSVYLDTSRRLPASADTIETRCSGYGDCYRVRCDDYHEDCVRMGYYNSGYYNNGYRRWVCDADGDDCHWVYDNGYHYRHYYYDHPGVSFGFHF